MIWQKKTITKLICISSNLPVSITPQRLGIILYNSCLCLINDHLTCFEIVNCISEEKNRWTKLDKSQQGWCLIFIKPLIKNVITRINNTGTAHSYICYTYCVDRQSHTLKLRNKIILPNVTLQLIGSNIFLGN